MDDFASKIQQAINTVFSPSNFATLAPQIRELLYTSIQYNFKVGGRYGTDNVFGGGSTKWLRSKAAIKRGGQTLLNTGQLAASIYVNVRVQNNTIQIKMGSNKNYAAIHQYGSRGAILRGRAKKTGYTIPARPYLVIQNQDLANIKDLILKQIKSKL